MGQAKFGSIKHLISEQERWREHVSDSADLITASHKHGEIIVRSDDSAFNAYANGDYIGIVTEGVAELIEDYPLTASEKVKSFAYRPIRILKVGDIFSDFSVVDKHVFDVKPKARPGESWKLRCGRRSSHILTNQNISLKARYIDTDHDQHAAHKFLEDRHPEPCKVAYLYVANLSATNQDFFRELLICSWRRAYTYRSCLNSYNVEEKLKFRYSAFKSVRALLKKAGSDAYKPYRDKVNRYEITEPILDAIFDAINRPMRGEPVFAAVREYQNEESTVLVSALASDHDTSYFPIGRHNYLVAKHAIAAKYGSEIVEGINLDPPRAPESSGKKTITNNKGVSREVDYYDDGKKGNGIHYWLEFCKIAVDAYYRDLNERIDEYAKEMARYELSVEALRLSDDNFDIFLVFKKK